MDEEGSIRGKDARRESAERHDEHPLPHRTRRGGLKGKLPQMGGRCALERDRTTRRMQGQSGKGSLSACSRAVALSLGPAHTASTPASTSANARPVTPLQKLARLEGHLAFWALRCSCPTRVATRPCPLELRSSGDGACVRALLRGLSR